MQKRDIVVGQKIRGYGILNEFGEFDFIPEQTGIRQGATKLIKSNDTYTISETKKLVVIHLRLPKDKPMKIMANFLNWTTVILNDLKKYEF